MMTPVLQRSFVAAGLTLQTEVLETAHKVIARVLHADREILAVSLDRKFADSPQGQTLLGAGSVTGWLADQAEQPFMQAKVDGR